MARSKGGKAKRGLIKGPNSPRPARGQTKDKYGRVAVDMGVKGPNVKKHTR